MSVAAIGLDTVEEGLWESKAVAGAESEEAELGESVAVAAVVVKAAMLAELDSLELELELELEFDAELESAISESLGCPGRRGLTPAASSISFT